MKNFYNPGAWTLPSQTLSKICLFVHVHVPDCYFSVIHISVFVVGISFYSRHFLIIAYFYLLIFDTETWILLFSRVSLAKRCT